MSYTGNAPRPNAEVKAKMNLVRLAEVPIMRKFAGGEAGAVDADGRAACSSFCAAFPDFGHLLAQTQPHDPLVARPKDAARIDFKQGQILF